MDSGRHLRRIGAGLAGAVGLILGRGLVAHTPTLGRDHDRGPADPARREGSRLSDDAPGAHHPEADGGQREGT